MEHGFKVGDKVRYRNGQVPLTVTAVDDAILSQVQLDGGLGNYPWVDISDLTPWEDTCKSPSCTCGIACEVMTLDADGNLSGPPADRFPGMVFIPEGYQAWLTDCVLRHGPIWVAPGAIVTIRAVDA